MTTANYTYWPSKAKSAGDSRGLRNAIAGNIFGTVRFQQYYGPGVTPVTSTCCDYQTTSAVSPNYVAPCCEEAYLHSVRPFSILGHVMTDKYKFGWTVKGKS